MANLTRASRELFRRTEDERFESLSDLSNHCGEMKEQGRRYREPGPDFEPVFADDQLRIKINGHGQFRLNDWSCSQLCGLAGISKDTLNRLQPKTATEVLVETLHQRIDEESDLQALVHGGDFIRSINSESYKRLWNADLIAVLQEFATDFTPPQKGFNGATGLYAGEQDMFCFLIDPNGWTEINDEAFAPGFFVWNSEVGKRTVGIQTFWFQAVCQNHIVWDAVEVVEFTRKHTGRVREALSEIRSAIETLVAKRDERKDGFARVIAKAMETSYGTTVEEVQELLAKRGFAKTLAKKAAELARQQGGFTIWSVVDALTQLARQAKYAGTRTVADQKASSLLSLATKA
jgi:predicted GNAT family acetyltransferase